MDKPKYLYHYTSQEGLLGILQTNKLWMTNILYLNDSSEFTHTLDLVKSELGNRMNHLGKLPADFKSFEWEDMGINTKRYTVYNDMKSDFDFTHSDMRPNIYVFSLSKEKNDLSQWRGYCPNGIGFCIEFNTEKLLNTIKETKYDLIKCIYDKEEKETIVKLLFDSLESLFESGSKNKQDLSYLEPGFKTIKISYKGKIEIIHYLQIMDVSPRMKDESFKNENEYRIVQKVKSNEKKYRQGNSMIIPYIEGVLVDDDNKLPISKIIVGPTPHPELSKLSVESLLKSEKYKGVEVEISKIPYRSW